MVGGRSRGTFRSETTWSPGSGSCGRLLFMSYAIWRPEIQALPEKMPRAVEHQPWERETMTQDHCVLPLSHNQNQPQLFMARGFCLTNLHLTDSVLSTWL